MRNCFSIKKCLAGHWGWSRALHDGDKRKREDREKEAGNGEKRRSGLLGARQDE